MGRPRPAHLAPTALSSRSMVESLEGRRMLSATPTAAEQYMLQLVNYARAHPTAEAASYGVALNEGLAAGSISAGAKQPLAFNANLTAAARNHNAWMSNNNTFAHNEGSATPGTQMSNAGYRFTGAWTWGQNIAWQGSRPNWPDLNSSTAQLEKNLFVDSAEPGRGHRLNIMNPAFKEAGIGVLETGFQGYNSVLATQDFASVGGNSFLTGVAFSDAVVHDNFYEPGEGLGNVTVTAVRAADHATFSTTTWAAGGYSLQLAPGTYSVTATGGTLRGTVYYSSVSIGSQNVEVDFTPAMVSRVSTNPAPVQTPAPVAQQPSTGFGLALGTVFVDANGNGVRDAGEAAVVSAKLAVSVLVNGNWQATNITSTTNAAGQYGLKLPAGTYRISEVLPAGTRVTNPASDALVVTLGGGLTQSNLNFANA